MGNMSIAVTCAGSVHARKLAGVEQPHPHLPARQQCGITHLTILELVGALNSPVPPTIAALKDRAGLCHWDLMREQSIAQQSGYEIMLSCQPALLAVVDGYRSKVDLLV
ncbi:hypothetical protein ACJQWK_00675 [Exserohilum turcicum]